jgi:putative sterol carrier protein
MPTKEEVFQSLDEIRAKFDDPQIKEKFKGYQKDLQFRFPDLQLAYVLKITAEPTASLVEGSMEKPNISVETDSATFLGIRTKKVSGTQAYMTGKLKVKGSMPDLLKLQKLM